MIEYIEKNKRIVIISSRESTVGLFVSVLYLIRRFES